MVQLLGTLFVVLTLVTARESVPWIWGFYGASAVCWTGFVLAAHRWPRLAQALLVAASLLPALALGEAEDSSAIVLCVIAAGRAATLVGLSVAAIAAVGVTDIVLAAVTGALAGSAPYDVGANILVVLVVLLLGLNRRQYEVQAVQTAELLEQTKLAQAESTRAAALDERTRIAREIHDVLAHSLGALGVQLELAEALLAEKSDVDGALVTVRRSRRLAAEGLDEARQAVAALRRDVLPLAEALEVLTEAHRRDHRTEVDFTSSGEARSLPSAAVVSLVATAREALTNAAKHAPGARVDLRLEFEPATVRLRVRNELTGAAGALPGEGGFGLTGMGERLALAGGSLTSGRDGSCWVLTAEVRA